MKMTNKERLESIKNKLYDFQTTVWDLSEDDYMWLVEQVEETEKYVQVVSKDADYLLGHARTLEYENVRLREALETIANEDGVSEGYQYADQVADNLISIAKSALEENK